MVNTWPLRASDFFGISSGSKAVHDSAIRNLGSPFSRPRIAMGCCRLEIIKIIMFEPWWMLTRRPRASIIVTGGSPAPPHQPIGGKPSTTEFSVRDPLRAVQVTPKTCHKKVGVKTKFFFQPRGCEMLLRFAERELGIPSSQPKLEGQLPASGVGCEERERRSGGRRNVVKWKGKGRNKRWVRRVNSSSFLFSL